MKTKEEGTLFNSSYVLGITLILKPDKDNLRKANYTLVSYEYLYKNSTED